MSTSSSSPSESSSSTSSSSSSSFHDLPSSQCTVITTLDPTVSKLISSTFTEHQDFPKPGINFINILPLFRQPSLVRVMVKGIAQSVQQHFPSSSPLYPTVIVGLESRGFLFGPMLAEELNLPFVCVRKAGKLPGECITYSYDLEYGSATIQIQKNSIHSNDKVLICDDLLATGGTVDATIKLMDGVQAVTVGVVVIVELSFLKGAQRYLPPTLTVLSV